MQYLGGKSRIAKQLAAYLTSVRKPGQLYVEPFCGACWVLQEMENPRQASDICEDLILMWQAVQEGWEPPVVVTREEHAAQKHAVPSPLRAFVGFGCSFAGKWFGGYAFCAEGRNYARVAHDSILKKAPKLAGVDFRCCDYRTVSLIDALIYCDPPYAGRYGYDAAGTFDSDCFWDQVRRWSTANTVLVSEEAAPDDFECVLEIERTLQVRSRQGHEKRTERLFRWKGAR